MEKCFPVPLSYVVVRPPLLTVGMAQSHKSQLCLTSIRSGSGNDLIDDNRSEAKQPSTKALLSRPKGAVSIVDTTAIYRCNLSVITTTLKPLTQSEELCDFSVEHFIRPAGAGCRSLGPRMVSGNSDSDVIPFARGAQTLRLVEADQNRQGW
jgi:hypothetical protein